MSKSKLQLKSKCSNIKTTPLGYLVFGSDLTFELCYLILLGVYRSVFRVFLFRPVLTIALPGSLEAMSG
jgi:hypothetical protein